MSPDETAALLAQVDQYRARSEQLINAHRSDIRSFLDLGVDPGAVAMVLTGKAAEFVEELRQQHGRIVLENLLHAYYTALVSAELERREKDGAR